MSHKIAKRVRKVLKSQGVDVKHATYNLRTVTNRHNEEKNIISLAPTAGRAIYQKAKRLAKGQ